MFNESTVSTASRFYEHELKMAVKAGSRKLGVSNNNDMSLSC